MHPLHPPPRLLCLHLLDWSSGACNGHLFLLNVDAHGACSLRMAFHGQLQWCNELADLLS